MCGAGAEKKSGAGEKRLSYTTLPVRYPLLFLPIVPIAMSMLQAAFLLARRGRGNTPVSQIMAK